MFLFLPSDQILFFLEGTWYWVTKLHVCLYAIPLRQIFKDKVYFSRNTFFLILRCEIFNISRDCNIVVTNSAFILLQILCLCKIDKLN